MEAAVNFTAIVSGSEISLPAESLISFARRVLLGAANNKYKELNLNIKININ
jgi:hypothetical protein